MSFFYSKGGKVAYKINGNKAQNTMQANILYFYTNSTPGFGQKVKTFFLKVM